MAEAASLFSLFWHDDRE